MNTKPKIIIRMPAQLHNEMLVDLKRQHDHAAERVGFLFASHVELPNDVILILCEKYMPVADENYMFDRNVGARINSAAIREAMQAVLEAKFCCFHVHLHNHKGYPHPSGTDTKSLPAVISSFISVGQAQPHGIMILSADSFYVDITWKDTSVSPTLISVVGYPMKFRYVKTVSSKKHKIYDRQSFLGHNAQFLFENVRVGIIGYGGGGSHIGQQLAHIGVKKVIVFDDDVVENTNMNRLIGASFSDIRKRTFKVNVAKRVFDKLLGKNELECIIARWQNRPEILQECDIIIGCVDSYTERQQLEAECRRYLIPYIDIGMDVYEHKSGPYMSGQVILSMPGMCCMNCVGFLTDEKLSIEAGKYGKVGGRPQVVWPNGILASSAVGIFVDIVTGWTGQENRKVYLAYDGNLGHLTEHSRLSYIPTICSHYPLNKIGSVRYTTL